MSEYIQNKMQEWLESGNPVKIAHAKIKLGIISSEEIKVNSKKSQELKEFTRKLRLMQSCINFNKEGCGCNENRCKIKPTDLTDGFGGYVAHADCMHCIDNNLGYESKNKKPDPTPESQTGFGAVLAKFAGFRPAKPTDCQDGQS